MQYENKIIKQISNNEVNERKNITDSRPPCTSLQHWARRPCTALGPPGIPRPWEAWTDRPGQSYWRTPTSRPCGGCLRKASRCWCTLDTWTSCAGSPWWDPYRSRWRWGSSWQCPRSSCCHRPTVWCDQACCRCTGNCNTVIRNAIYPTCRCTDNCNTVIKNVIYSICRCTGNKSEIFFKYISCRCTGNCNHPVIINVTFINILH